MSLWIILCESVNFLLMMSKLENTEGASALRFVPRLHGPLGRVRGRGLHVGAADPEGAPGHHGCCQHLLQPLPLPLSGGEKKKQCL